MIQLTIFAGQALQINGLGTDQRSQMVRHVVSNVEIDRNAEQRRQLGLKVCDIEQRDLPSQCIRNGRKKIQITPLTILISGC